MEFEGQKTPLRIEPRWGNALEESLWGVLLSPDHAEGFSYALLDRAEHQFRLAIAIGDVERATFIQDLQLFRLYRQLAEIEVSLALQLSR